MSISINNVVFGLVYLCIAGIVLFALFSVIKARIELKRYKETRHSKTVDFAKLEAIFCDAEVKVVKFLQFKNMKTGELFNVEVGPYNVWSQKILTSPEEYTPQRTFWRVTWSFLGSDPNKTFLEVLDKPDLVVIA